MVDSDQAEVSGGAQKEETTRNPRKGMVIWPVVVLVATAVSIVLWWVFALPGRIALITGCSAIFATAFAVAPYVRFIDHGWWTRYDEFRNHLWGDALSEYLWQFWHRRGEAAKALQYFIGFCRVKAGEVIFEPDKYALAGR